MGKAVVGVNKSSVSKQVSTDSDNNLVVKQARVTKQQLDILRHIYFFRFISTKQVQNLLGKKQLQQAQQRLNTLLDKQYIGRNFTNTDRLTGKYATYYLLPKGIKVLRHYQDGLNPRALHNIYKDKTASERFVSHCLSVGSVYWELRHLYSQDLKYMTNSMLAGNDRLPTPLPDAYFSLQTNENKNEFFLLYFEETVPFFVYRNRLKQYEQYADEGLWGDSHDTKLPTVLVVCETARLQRRVLRYLKKWLETVYEDDLRFLVTNDQLLTTAKPSAAIWTEFDAGEDTTLIHSLREL